jgi:ribosome biogenesis protein BRX1
MGKKRKHVETQVIEPAKKDEGAPERPKRTLLGWKDKPEVKETEFIPPQQGGFRNKEKVLVTCSRRINYRFRKDLIFFFFNI